MPMNADIEFSIRFAGIRYQFYCQRMDSYPRAIRKARALAIGGTVITAQPSQHWELNRQGTHWTYCASTKVGPVPVAKVQWALADNRKLIQAFRAGETTHWKIIRTVSQCYKCDASCERSTLYWHHNFGTGPQPGDLNKDLTWSFWTPVCALCLAKFDEIFRAHSRLNSFEGHHWEFLRRSQIDYIASQDRSANVRWVRKFVAVGKFTSREFRSLCSEYGNICLRCGKCRPLVADHVIPIARGGRNDIANIQPLCARCNGIKSDKSTDYRKRRRKVSSQLVSVAVERAPSAI